MTLRFTAAQGIALRAGVGTGYTRLEPRVLSDGLVAVSEAALSDPAHADLSETLALGEIADLSAASWASQSTRLKWLGKEYEFFADTKPWSVSMPSADVLRFEVRDGDVGWDGDAANNNNRSEVSAIAKVALGATVWESWSFMLEAGDSIPYGHCMVGQWHGTDLSGYSRSPASQFELGGDQFRITSRAGASTTDSGTLTVHLTEALPDRDTWLNFVRRTVFGSSGSLQVWRNGEQIVNYAGAIGYHGDAQGPYYKLGVYRNRHENSIAVRYANVEWGTADLTDRIENPLEIPA